MHIDRVYTKNSELALFGGTYFKFVKRASVLKDPNGKILFSMDNIEVPEHWSQIATDILAQKYLRKKGVCERCNAIEEKGVPIWLWKRIPPDGDYSFGGETSAAQVFHRLAGCWTYWGWKYKYFDTEEDAKAFYSELIYMLLAQIAAPNSPQLFNTGLNWAYGITGPAQGHYYVDPETNEVVSSIDAYSRPQPHACFLQSIDDHLITKGGLMDLWHREARLFKYGSGTGTNFSNIRGKGEPLAGGGVSSGLMSFLEVGDKSSGAIKSGGTTRRSACMRVLDITHPEIEDFINWKVKEEQKVADLVTGSKICKEHIDAIVKACNIIPKETPGDLEGWYDPLQNKRLKKAVANALKAHIPIGTIQRTIDQLKQNIDPTKSFKEYDVYWEGEAYKTVSGQNSNNSIRVFDEFMRSIQNDSTWNLYGRMELLNAKKELRPPQPCKTVDSSKLWEQICEAAWACADPGLQFGTTINSWNTCAESGEIFTSNPCVAGDELVITPFGPKYAEEMVADKFLDIFDGSGKDTQITAWHNNGIKKIVTVVLGCGIETKVSENHKFTLLDGTEKEAVTLQAGDVLKPLPTFCFKQLPLNFYTSTPFDFRYRQQKIAYELLPKEWTEELGYFLGYLVGDGYIADYKNEYGYIHRVHITLGKEHPKFVVDLLEKFSTGKLQRLNERENSVEYQTSSTGLVKWLRDLGVTTSKEEKRIPLAIWTAPDNIKFAFLSGLYDADGTKIFSKGRRTAQFCIGNKLNFSKELWILLKSLKISATIRKDKIDMPFQCGEKRYEYYTSSYSVSCPQADIYLKPNMPLCESFKKLNNTRVRKVPKLKIERTNVVEVITSGEETVYDFTIPTDYKFLTAAGINIDCGEYLFLDNTACNLASLNLVKFYDSTTNQFDYQRLALGSKLWTIVLDISVQMAQFPSKEIARNSYDFRTLGLGYANLGSLVMRMGFPYDSDKARSVCSEITAVMHCTSYITSSDMARELGTFPKYEENKKHVLHVIDLHHDATKYLSSRTRSLAREMVACAKLYGVRNAQVTLIAPTGTIGLLMDCDTTGIEPDYALVKRKTLAGGGSFDIVNQAIPEALKRLGYSVEIDDILKDLLKNYTVEGSARINYKDLAVFDCANKCGRSGTRFIDPMAHLKMMAAAQPFLSSGISKTTNLPASATVKDVSDIYFAAWEMGLKSIALYRDGSKLSQPLTSFSLEDVTIEDSIQEVSEEKYSNAFGSVAELPLPVSKGRLPDRRQGYTQKAKINGQTIYVRTGEYPDGSLGEIFIDMHKEGASYRSILNSFAIAVSLGLRYGVPLEEFVEAFTFTKFEPSGIISGHANIKMCTSVIDYIFRDLAINYLNRQDLAHIISTSSKEETSQSVPSATDTVAGGNPGRYSYSMLRGYTGDVCSHCGHAAMVRSGTCLRCEICGETSGCS